MELHMSKLPQNILTLMLHNAFKLFSSKLYSDNPDYQNKIGKITYVSFIQLIIWGPDNLGSILYQVN